MPPARCRRAFSPELVGGTLSNRGELLADRRERPDRSRVLLSCRHQYPQGNESLARNLNVGCMGQIGAPVAVLQYVWRCGLGSRCPCGVHLQRCHGRDIVTVEGEPVTVRRCIVQRSASVWAAIVFSAQPGFFLDTWDANFRLGFDIGGRWGTGHVIPHPFRRGWLSSTLRCFRSVVWRSDWRRWKCRLAAGHGWSAGASKGTTRFPICFQSGVQLLRSQRLLCWACATDSSLNSGRRSVIIVRPPRKRQACQPLAECWRVFS